MGCDHLESENHFYNNTTIIFYGNSLALYIYHYHVRGSIEESKRSNDVDHRFCDFDVLTSFRDPLPCRFFFAFPWSNSKRTTFTMTICTFFVLFVVLGNKSAPRQLHRNVANILHITVVDLKNPFSAAQNCRVLKLFPMTNGRTPQPLSDEDKKL